MKLPLSFFFIRVDKRVNSLLSLQFFFSGILICIDLSTPLYAVISLNLYRCLCVYPAVCTLECEGKVVVCLFILGVVSLCLPLSLLTFHSVVIPFSKKTSFFSLSFLSFFSFSPFFLSFWVSSVLFSALLRGISIHLRVPDEREKKERLDLRIKRLFLFPISFLRCERRRARVEENPREKRKTVLLRLRNGVFPSVLAKRKST